MTGTTTPPATTPHAANSNSFNGSPYSYGMNDLSYYGSFVSGCGGGGSMWRPYFASAAWDPYANGAWAYYQGAGYSWVSPYPWGWMPYHSGSWAFCQGTGWGWMPGNNWNGLNNMSMMPLGGGGMGGGGSVAGGGRSPSPGGSATSSAGQRAQHVGSEPETAGQVRSS